MIEYDLDEREIVFSACRSGGPGGQHVNKVSSAVHLHFDLNVCSLPEQLKAAVMSLSDRRIHSDGIITIKAQRFRSYEKNRADAIERLRSILEKAANPPTPRKNTRPSRASREKRLDQKKKRSGIKKQRKLDKSERHDYD